jgi:hypothetical protein
MTLENPMRKEELQWLEISCSNYLKKEPSQRSQKTAATTPRKFSKKIKRTDGLQIVRKRIRNDD